MSRQWIAWKLVRLARRLYDAEYEERIVIDDEHGQRGVFVIIGDNYGCGISSYSGPPARSFDPDRWEFGCSDVTWEAP